MFNAIAPDRRRADVAYCGLGRSKTADGFPRWLQIVRRQRPDFFIGVATVFVGLRIGRIEFDRFRVILQRPEVGTLAHIAVASVVVGEHIFWIEPYRFIVVGDAALAFVLGGIFDAAVVIELREINSLEPSGSDGTLASRDRCVAGRIRTHTLIVSRRSSGRIRKEQPHHHSAYIHDLLSFAAHN